LNLLNVQLHLAPQNPKTPQIIHAVFSSVFVLLRRVRDK